MNDYRFDRDPTLRASDSEREQTADRLRRSHADGRLDVQEFQDRLDRCYAAKTAGELSELVADLPGERGIRDRVPPQRSFAAMRFVPIIPLLLGIILVSAIIHGHGLWVLLPLLLLTRVWWWRHRTGSLPWHRGGADWRA